MLDRRRRRWADIESALVQRIMFAGKPPTLKIYSSVVIPTFQLFDEDSLQ